MAMNVVGSQNLQFDMCRHLLVSEFSENTWPILDQRAPGHGLGKKVDGAMLRFTDDLEKESRFSNLGTPCTTKSPEDC